ncbi:hypothetical protein Y042_5782 [Burkholderia pseudomallei MSHR1357]|nr:hypothetical protein Y042_5782 [Burkholderia pseudomallei MSHR1357]
MARLKSTWPPGGWRRALAVSRGTNRPAMRRALRLQSITERRARRVGFPPQRGRDIFVERCVERAGRAEHRDAGRGRLHARPALAWCGRSGGGRGRFARAGAADSRGFQGRGLVRHRAIVVRVAFDGRRGIARVTTIGRRCRLTRSLILRSAY